MKTYQLVLVLLIATCQLNKHRVTPFSATGEFIDYGAIPAPVDTSQKAADLQVLFLLHHIYHISNLAYRLCHPSNGPLSSQNSSSGVSKK